MWGQANRSDWVDATIVTAASAEWVCTSLAARLTVLTVKLSAGTLDLLVTTRLCIFAYERL